MSLPSMMIEAGEQRVGAGAIASQGTKGLGPARAGLEHFKSLTANGAPVEGWFRPDLAKLRDVFIGLHAGDNPEPEIGSAVAIYAGDILIADMWGGWSDRDRTRAWEDDTLVQIQSAIKGIVATCIHILVDRGLLALDEPVATYWPEFAANDKGRIKVSHILAQTSGLIYAEGVAPGDFYRPDAMAAALAAQPALWEAGTQAGYQMVTQGFLLGELVRRVDGRTIGRFIAEELSGPLGADLHLGLDNEQISRTADLVFPEASPQLSIDPQSLAFKAMSGIPGPPPLISNAPEWRRSEIPAANGHATARGLARIYAAVAGSWDDDGLFSRATLENAIEEQHDMVEIVLGRHYHTAAGYILHSPPIVELGGRPTAFGHHGMGGSIGFADLDGAIGFGYVTNRLHARPTNGPRSTALIEAFYEALD